jgi:HEAT repeat protein
MEDNMSIEEMLHDADPYVRRDACESIEESRSEEYVAELVKILEDEDLGVREAALNALTAIGGKSVAVAVIPTLGSEDVAIRNIGVEILEQLGSAAVEPVGKVLNDSDDDVVKFGVDILSKIKDPRVEGLLAPLVEHKNPNVRAAVVLCMGKVDVATAVPTLLKALGDSEEWVRFSAIEGLGHLEDKGALEALLGIIESESGLAQEAALDAVARIASSEDSIKVLPKVEALLAQGHVLSVGAVVELIEKALMPGSSLSLSDESREVFFKCFSEAVGNEDREVQEKGLRGLGRLRMAEAFGDLFAYIEALQEIDQDMEDLLVDTIASIIGAGSLPGPVMKELGKGGKNLKVLVRAISETRSEEAVPILEELIKEAGKEEGRLIVEALEKIASPDSTAVLKRLLSHTDGHTRKTAARAFAALAGGDAVGPVFEALKVESYKDVMEEMTDVLALIPSEEVKDGFCAFVSSEKESLREMGARGLGVVCYEGVFESLKKGAADKSPAVRKAAYRSMTMLGIVEATGDLLNGLADPDDDVKLSVLKGLSGWLGEGLTEALIKALKDPNVWVRYHAVTLLGDILAEGGSADGIEELILALMASDEPPVMAASAAALGKAGTELSLEALVQYIDHEDSNVSAAVESALEMISCRHSE